MGDMILTVDTQIVMIAHHMATKAASQYHIDLMEAFSDKARLALDKHTEQEYRNNMRADSDGIRWLTRLANKDRIEFIHAIPAETRKTKVAFDKIRFSKGDMRFVRLAKATALKILVAEEPHFANVAQWLKKEEEISVIDSQTACDCIEANLT